MDYKTDDVWLMQGDCLERSKEIPKESVDLVLTDLPYGTTNAKWDSVIPLTYHIVVDGKVMYIEDALRNGISLNEFDLYKKRVCGSVSTRLVNLVRLSY